MTRLKTKNPSPTTKRQVVLRPAPVNHRDPLLSTQPALPHSGARRARLAEVAGTTSAECVAISCCCPCAIADFFLLAVYRVPAGLCRRALRKRRRRRRLARQVAFTSKRGGRSGKKGSSGRDGDGEGDDSESTDAENAGPVVMTLEELLEMRATAAGAAAGGVEEGAEMEVEMWRTFSNMGFWRSPSRGVEEEEEERNAMQNLTLEKF